MKAIKAAKNMDRQPGKKLAVFLLAAVIIFSAVAVPLRPARAIPVEDIPALIWNKVSEFTAKLWRTAGSVAFQRTLTTALNKIAYDTATWIGSGHQGQKPLFITNPWTYLGNVGDEAGGQFLETFVNNLNREDPQNCDADFQAGKDRCLKTFDEMVARGEDPGSGYLNCIKEYESLATACVSQNASTINATPSFNVCAPSSLSAKLKIGLGLVQQSRPQGPNCTLSEIVRNWSTDSLMRAAGLGGTGLTGNEYLRHFSAFFDPRANDLGIYVSAQADMSNAKGERLATEKLLFETGGGWLDVRNIAGDSAAPPGTAARELESAKRSQETNIGTITGDAFVDAANVFINQYAISAFNELMRSLSDKTKRGSSGGALAGLNNPQSDPSAYYGVSSLKEATTKLLQPDFGVRADYNILSSLVICPDAKNPGPDNCVIDNQFMQAISEKKTVAEALEGGYLHGEWQLTNENNPSTYSLRNISILRKYRIVPAGWELAIQKIVAVNPPKKATMKDLVSCFDKTDRYNDFSTEFDQRDQNWCEGLVDPNWVLKAPLNYCRQEGIGGQILSKTIIPGTPGESNATGTPSEINIVRAGNYCADNQTCIKERVDGSCEAYGYCNEEKRTWNFGSDSCQPINNTCQSFTSSVGATVAYLQNTLDYSSCNPENSGCRQYALTGSYAAATGKVSWSNVASAYFNNNLSGCDSRNEGCTGLLRVKPTWGSNLVMNANFENDQVGDSAASGRLNDWPLNSSQGVIVSAAEEPGGLTGKAIKLTTSGPTGGVYSSGVDSLLPVNFQTIPGQAYTVSADVYLKTGDSVRLVAGANVSEGYVKSMTVKNNWQRLSVTRPATVAYNTAEFYITGQSTAGQAVFYVKNIKFEMSNWDTGYSPYGSYKVYEKLLPPYLEQTCYIDAANADYRLKTDAPAVCANFARKCNKSEVGCESYASVLDGFSVPAQVTSNDYCSGACLGYDVYIARGSYFSSPSADNLIPNTATVCSAAAAGCSEFTNLDNVIQGGEQKEYYSTLKQCVKPSASDCATFYSWEGTGSGYQLRSFTLKKNATNLPAVTSNDSTLCSAAIYKLPVTDSGYNPDCREYYNSAGQVAYHLASRTITCSDNCHAYRMTEKNVDKGLTQSQCVGADKHWDGASSSCNVCLNGGIWDNARSACIYQAIPGEGQPCQAVENGCREYNGSRGANIRLAVADDFENGLGGWTSNCSGGISLSTVANSNNGHSLQYNNGISCGQLINTTVSRRPLIESLLADDNLAAQLKVYGLVRQGSAYTVRFLARASSNSAIKIFFLNPDTGERSDFNAAAPVTVKGGNEWNIYQANLDNLDHAVGLNEIIGLTANGDFYLDDFRLSEITDRYYLIRNSSRVPSICYYDSLNNYQGAEYNLGCAQYTDPSGLKHNLHRFSGLCSDSAVGCEQMIDTQDYTPYGPGYWYEGIATSTCLTSDPDCLLVPGDSAIYAVFNSSKLCGASDQGCSRLGQGQGGASLIGWVDTFKKNNPDQYAQTLCGPDSAGCEAWKNSDNGETSYFKDPGAGTCIYRASSDVTVPGKNWYRIPVKRCDLNNDGSVSGSLEQNGPTCLSDGDCANSRKCIEDNNDYPCSFTYEKTFGYGGANNQIPVPDQQAALCEVSASSCTEYIDPVSRAASNLVLNPTYVTTYDQDGVSNLRQEGWGKNSMSGWSGVTATSTEQFIRVRPNTIYSLSYKPASSGLPTGTVGLNFQNSVKPLLLNNKLGGGVTNLAVTASNQPLIFNSLHNDFALVSGADTLKSIEVKELLIGYQLQKGLDKQSCNGLVDFNNGCVLFNERSVSGASGLADLTSAWDPYQTADRQPPQNCVVGSSGCAANQLIKVRPDRVCGKWLDCISYVQDPFTKKKTCYAFAECDRLDDKGECANFINLGSSQNFVPQANQNATGYTLINRFNLSNMFLAGKSIEDLRGDFDNETDCGGHYCFISEPDEATTDYPADGKGYLQVKNGKYYEFPATFSVSSVATDEYFINYLLNTKGSGGSSGIIEIRYDNIIERIEEKAETGWERKVRSFTISPGKKEVTIRLNAGAAGDVYFDDVSVQPVLKTASSTYSVPECRLYPTTDSLGCLSKNENVVSNGLNGYCLEKDPLNKDVCLLWYPMDNIPLPAISKLGYNGNFPLNYCTQVSGDFDLVERRRGFFSEEFMSDMVIVSGTSCDVAGTYGSNNTRCIKSSGQCEVIMSFSFGVGAKEVTPCPVGYNLWISQKWCPGNCDEDNYFKILCVPDPGMLVDRNGTSMIDNPNANNGNSANLGNWEECQGSTYSTGYSIFNGFQGFEAGSAVPGYLPDSNPDPNPNLKIRDYSSVFATVDDLKIIPGTSTANVNYFHFTCNQLVQAVNPSGVNAAWVDRVSTLSTYNLGSPLFKDYYTQSMVSAPFGGLIANVNSGSGVITLGDITTEPLAGRPYGCTNGIGGNCKLVGTCNASSSLLCLATSTTNAALDTATCAGGNGTCEPLFNANQLSISAKTILKNIFLTGINGLKRDGNSLTYTKDDSINYNYTSGRADAPSACPNGVRIPRDSYCYILPKVENLKLFFNDNQLELGSTASYDVKQKGIYRLEFNTTVDTEQQPLKSVTIDWGDGYTQTITNQDHLPPPDSPHVFYHYYNQTGLKTIKVKAQDNWNYFKEI